MEKSIGFDKDLLDRVLSEIYNEEVKPSDGEIPQELFDATRDIFEQATAEGFANGNLDVKGNENYLKQYTHSVEVFSTFRVHTYAEMLASKLHDEEGNLRSFQEWKKETASIQSHFNENWLRTEYNTAILRAEQAADWRQFEKDKDIMPNLKWMPTSSATPREEHAVFWKQGLTLPVDDKFWDEHHPGDLWNCKCWLEQTDAKSTTKKEMPAKKEMPTPARGLKSNPGKKAEMYDDSHPYYPDPKTCLWLRLAKQAKQSGAEAKLGSVVNAVKCVHDCNLCEIITLLKQKKNLKLFEKLKIDKNYESVNYNAESGALKATHKKHNKTGKGNKFFTEENGGRGYTGNQLELFCQNELYKSGHSCILLEEKKMSRNKGGELTALDALIDGIRMDIRSVSENSDGYRNRLTKKNKQLIRWNKENPDDKSHAMCLYFHREEFFSDERMLKTIEEVKSIFDRDGSQQLHTVYCVVRGKNKLYKYQL